METVASRLSRSSTRYGPISSSTSFSGPVRKWRKAWTPLAGAAGAAGGVGSAGIGPIGCSRGNKVVLFKWTPVNGATGGGGDGKKVAAEATRRRYIPVSGVTQISTKKGSSTELNLNLGLEDPDDDTDADLSTDEQHDPSSILRSENRLKRKAF